MPSQRQEKPMTERVDKPLELTFERDVRPMVREDVRARQDAISDKVCLGRMPCDGPWPPEQVAVSQRWIAGGSPP